MNLTPERIQFLAANFFDFGEWAIIAREIHPGETGFVPCRWPLLTPITHSDIPEDLPTMVLASRRGGIWQPGLIDNDGNWCRIII